MPNRITEQNVPNSIFDYLNLAGDINNPADGKIHLAKNGKLYVSQPRGKVLDRITRLVVRVAELFGVKNISVKKKVADVKRETVAAEAFINLVNNELQRVGKESTNYTHESLSAPTDYSAILGKIVLEDKKILAPVFNEVIVGSHKLKPSDFSGEKALKVLEKLGIDIDTEDPEYKEAFAETYNNLLSYNVTTRTNHLTSNDEIEELMTAHTYLRELLTKLAENRDFCLALPRYNAAIERCVNGIVDALDKKDPSELAKWKLTLCSVQQIFMKKNGATMKFNDTSSSYEVLLQSAIEKAFTNRSADKNSPSRLLDECFLANNDTDASQVNTIANKTVIRLINGDMNYLSLFPALESFDTVCFMHMDINSQKAKEITSRFREDVSEVDKPNPQNVHAQVMLQLKSTLGVDEAGDFCI